MTVGISETDSQEFSKSTSMTVGCEVGAQYGGASARVSTSFTQSFSLTTATSQTNSSSTTVTTTVKFPEQPTTWIWVRQTQIAVFRDDQSELDPVSYGNEDERLVPSG